MSFTACLINAYPALIFSSLKGTAFILIPCTTKIDQNLSYLYIAGPPSTLGLYDFLSYYALYMYIIIILCPPPDTLQRYPAAPNNTTLHNACQPS